MKYYFPRRCHFVFAMLFLLIGTVAFAQQTIVNGVVLRLGRIPMPYARVTYRHVGTGQTYNTRADANGRYTLRDLVLSVRENDQAQPAPELEGVLTNNGGATANFQFTSGKSIDRATVYNITGQQVTAIQLQSVSLSGNRWLSYGFWDGKNTAGRPVSNGVYFLAVREGQRIKALKFIRQEAGNVVSPLPYDRLYKSTVGNPGTVPMKQVPTIALESDYEVTVTPDSTGTRFFQRAFIRSVRDTINNVVDSVTAPPPRTILFVGNSYSANNGGIDLHFHNFCANADTTTAPTTSNSIIGGSALQDHWSDTALLQMIRENHYDLVILQEGSQRPFMDSLNMFAYADSFTTVIRQAGSEAGFFMTWTHRPDSAMFDVMASSYWHCGRTFGATVVPVGKAWITLLRSASTINLFEGDSSHPSVYGTYLAICVFYGALMNRTPVGVPYVNDIAISADDRDYLQRLAWETVQRYPAVTFP